LGAGGNSSTSTNYRLESTAGHSGTIGISSNASNRLEAGLWYGTSDRDDDGLVELSDNCPEVSNPGQDNNDGDAVGDACDMDDDNDGISDTFETGCGTDPLAAGSLTPERVDGTFAGVDDDGDTQVDEALPGGAGGFDCDGDGFTGTGEAHVYSYLPQTDGDQKTCQQYDLTHPNPNADIKPSLRWPADFNKATGVLNSFNRIDVLDLTSFLAPVKYIGTNVGTNPSDIRWDLRPGPEIFGVDINAADLTSLLAGVTGNPPMLGGVKAMNGPACPWSP
jgi:hypothetical protein